MTIFKAYRCNSFVDCLSMLLFRMKNKLTLTTTTMNSICCFVADTYFVNVVVFHGDGGKLPIRFPSLSFSEYTIHILYKEKKFYYLVPQNIIVRPDYQCIH